IFRNSNVALGHRRLAIIDTSDAASQPMTDASGRYTIIFNGEFFSFKEHRSYVESKGYKLRTSSDTEVLLYLYMIDGPDCLKKVNGFFSFAVYDIKEETLFIARDRMGVKPLLYFRDDEKLFFASEMKSLLAMGIPRELDYASLRQYFQFYYIPAPFSIFKNVRKLLPGTFALLNTRDNNSFRIEKYYSIPQQEKKSLFKGTYDDAKNKFHALMDKSVERRLISDVSLGTFLSGGIDSSVITAIASQQKEKLKTFSIGFKDNPYYDETDFAAQVARKCRTDHTAFFLTKDDLHRNLHSVLDYIDEPFADSSALPVHILSMYTRKHVTVTLSGDGADEIFGGYNKHFAELMAGTFRNSSALLKLFLPMLSLLSSSRSSKFANRIRQASRFVKGASLSPRERYWYWASFNEETEGEALLNENGMEKIASELLQRKNSILSITNFTNGMNDVFYADAQFVLPNDMLTKVDLMSMANSLEVRVPFLDYEVVDFAFSLPQEFKIDFSQRKKIVRDTFQHLLPPEILTRGKQGFEVPLLDWFRGELKTMISDELLSDEMIVSQNIFNKDEIKKILARLWSSNPGDTPLLVWSLIVFQHWWKKYLRA
ncbi:MAG: asparagine synthase (glutamine-hydrolyzing), partial [Bacteroidia bacterium]|nr:asparagine synthase (glutamine-hydrolyzing) [Bacteroidia bacterium]